MAWHEQSEKKMCMYHEPKKKYTRGWESIDEKLKIEIIKRKQNNTKRIER